MFDVCGPSGESLHYPTPTCFYLQQPFSSNDCLFLFTAMCDAGLQARVNSSAIAPSVNPVFMSCLGEGTSCLFVCLSVFHQHST